MKDRKHIEQNFHSVAGIMPQRWELGVLGVKNFSMGICDGAPSTGRSSYDYRSSVTASMLDQLSWRPLSKDGWMLTFVSSRWSMELWQYLSQTTSSPHIVSHYCHSMTFRQIHTGTKYSFFSTCHSPVECPSRVCC